MHYYEVAPNRIIRAGVDTYTYAAQTRLRPGQLVIVEIGKTTSLGVIVSEVEEPSYTTKLVTKVLDDLSIPYELLSMLLWLSEYYKTALATVLQVALPRDITKERRKSYTPILVAPTHEVIPPLTNDQKEAIKKLDDSTTGTSLVRGITGSGKTIVYIDQVKKVLNAGRSAIILVPEIALTKQLLDNLITYIDNEIIVTHSQQTEAERHSIWKRCVLSTKPLVIIGPRSALFMPVRNIGVIVLDEMHEPSFKQEQSPRYSALRAASILGRHHKAKIILGSATPTVSEYYYAATTHQPIVEMLHTARTNAIRPLVELIDMKKPTSHQAHRFISNNLFVQIQSTLAQGNQVLIFHNRRGSAPITLCDNCGWQAGCPRCFIPLTLHADTHQLRCHICGFKDQVPTSCPVCQKTSILHKGIGTKLIEIELKKLFPSASIVRFDGDTEKKQGVDQRYEELLDGSIDIIIGTQVIAKGLDLPHLRMVGIIQADVGLTLPDFSASERTFQLLAQVIGRVGRSSHPTNVIIQTYQPDHPSIQFGIKQDYDGFYKYIIPLRQQMLFPPFTFLLKLTCSYKTEAAAVRNATKLATELRSILPKHVTILGPAPSFYERQHNTYRWQLTLKSPRRSDLVSALDHLPAKGWTFELDPNSLL